MPIELFLPLIARAVRPGAGIHALAALAVRKPRRVLLAAATLAAALASCLAHAQPAIDAAQLLPRLYSHEPSARIWSDRSHAILALELLRTAPAHGLDPAHYDVAVLSGWLENMDGAGTAELDRTLSRAMLQFLADLRIGRVAPDAQLPLPEERLQQFDPVEQLRLAIRQGRLREMVKDAAPKIPLYSRVQATLQLYRGLAELEEPWSAPEQLPPGGKLVAGHTYPGLGRLRARLELLGDFDPGDPATAQDQHSEALAQAIRRFQARHGLAETGHLGRDTLAALGVPLSERVRQLTLTLERLRWMPALRPGRIIVVNVAAYRLWAFDTAADNRAEPLEMRVIVGKAARTQTPLFIGQMRYLEFNPYWNVPSSIAIGEIAPKLARNRAHLSQNRMELVSRSGQVLDPASFSVAALRAGTLRIRQTPGPHNVLGAVKFAMPNPMNIYLHSTSAKELFDKARRDLSHGCIRVERPAELVRFVLADQPQWNAQAIAAAMTPGRPTSTVRLAEAIPVVLFYATATTDRRGRALFADDIYRRDRKLAQALQARQ